MPRLFTGLEIPPLVGQSLSLLRGGLPGARWIDPENYHLTLSFIGDIDDGAAHEVASALDGVRRVGFEVRLEGLGQFGDRKPHTVFAKAAQTPDLMALQADQERVLRRLGIAVEGRRFTPHVTLARLRDTSARQLADYLAIRGGPAALAFSVERFVLFSSRPSVGGGPYVIEAAYDLLPAAPARRAVALP